MSHTDKSPPSPALPPTPSSRSKSVIELSSPRTAFTTSSIKHSLMNDSLHYQVIPNNNKRSTAQCWKTFGFPAVVHDDDPKKLEAIPGYVTCKTCFDTYKYIDSSTANLYNHRCYRNDSSNQSTITTFIRSPRSSFNSSKNASKKKEELKRLCARWIACSMRPFQVVADHGFKQIVQASIDIGKEIRGESDLAADDLLPSDRTVKNELKRMACIKRNELKFILLEAANNHALSISPDNWTDNHRRVAYMGATAHFIDESLTYQSVDLFCVEFRQAKKTAENIYQLMENQLGEFDLDQHMNDITFVTDRGSNFLKAFQSLKALFCVAHRLNNILKRCFYQNPAKKTSKASDTITQPVTTVTRIEETPKKKKTISTTYSRASPEAKTDPQKENEEESDTDDEDDDDERDYTEVTVAQLPADIRHVLDTIKSCKSLVKYVKKSGLNRQLQLVQNQSENEDPDEDTTTTKEKSFNARTLHQSSVVRWLSLSNLLESIRNAYPALVIVLNNNKQNSHIQKINMETVEKLIEFLYPWKIVLSELQKTNTPSLHLVLPCITYLRNELINGDRKEKSGIKFFYKRASQLLTSMFYMEEEYIIGSFLHPNYKQLRGETSLQIADCHSTCRLSIRSDLSSNETVQECYEPPSKKTKVFMSTLMDTQKKQQTGADEIDRYINLVLDEQEQYENPLAFWKKPEYQSTFPNLARLARKYYSIPSSSAAVERQFSAAGQIINQRRSNLDPCTVNDIIFLRSMEKQLF